MRCKLWQDCNKWSRLLSVIRGQLSNSNTAKCSAAQGDKDNCLIPSSVINSQCDKLWRNIKAILQPDYNEINKGELTNFSSLGQPIAKWVRVASVIITHSSKSIFSKSRQFCKDGWHIEIGTKIIEWIKEKHSPWRELGIQRRWNEYIRRILKYWAGDSAKLTWLATHPLILDNLINKRNANAYIVHSIP